MYIFVTIKDILEKNPRFIQSTALSDRTTTTDFTEFPTARLFHELVKGIVRSDCT